MSVLLRERLEHIETWTLNLPEQRNPITSGEVVDAIVESVNEVNHDASIRCVILTGRGQAFSSGGNIKDIRAGRGYFGAPPYAAADGYRNGVQRIPSALYQLEVPAIAAVNGAAIGAGCDLALMCDFRIASTNAVFAASFVKLGLIPGDGGAWLLPRIVGHARASEMLLVGEAIDAQRALAWGLVSEVVEHDQLMASAMTLALRIAGNPPLATRMAKRLLREAETQSLHGALELSAALQALAHHTSDHREALSAAGDARTPRFRAE
jgi:enoyl-CoA hydratase/carnithine racemase